MSFTGKVEAQCPKGCEPYAADVWSFVRGDDIRLRDGLLAGDLNLQVCPECNSLFYPDATVVYYDPSAELLAFVLPEAYRKEEEMWKKKIHEDFLQMKQALASDMPIDMEPILCFGMDSIRELLQRDDDLEDEAMVADHLCRELGLALYPVDRIFARKHDLPWTIPYAKKEKVSAASLGAGLDQLIKKNDRLHGYVRWREFLRAKPEVPPTKKSK